MHYTPKQIQPKTAPSEDRTRFDTVGAGPGERLESSIQADVDEVHSEPDWTHTIKGVPARKDHINIRVDHDVLQWFRSNGKGYQTLMNNVLRAFVQARQQRDTRKPQ